MLFSERAIGEAAILRARMIAQIAEADPHVAMERVWHGHRHAEAHDAMSQPEGVDVSVAQKQDAGDSSPDESDWSQDGVGQVGEREDAGRGEDGRGFPWQET